MVSVTLDESAAAQLGDISLPVEIRDGKGRILGYFTPVSQAESEMYRLALASTDPQELARRKNSPGPRFTTEEVRRHLKSLEHRVCDSP